MTVMPNFLWGSVDGAKEYVYDPKRQLGGFFHVEAMEIHIIKVTDNNGMTGYTFSVFGLIQLKEISK